MKDIFNVSFSLADDSGIQYLGLINTPKWPSNEDAYFEYEIEADCMYRPDIMAYRFYNDQELSWVIDDINNFTSLKEYRLSRKIKILKAENLERLGII